MALNSLHFAAIQSTTKDQSFEYFDPYYYNRTTNFSAASYLFNATNEVSSRINELTADEKRELLADLKPIKRALENKINIGYIKTIWWACFSPQKIREIEAFKQPLAKVNEIERQLKPSEAPVDAYTPRHIRRMTFGETIQQTTQLTCEGLDTHQEALCRFMEEFPKRFGTKPSPLAQGESIDLFETSKRIWNSNNVQTRDGEKYRMYSNLMEEFVIGSHMLFEEDEKANFENDSTLFATLATHLTRGNVRGTLEDRVSTHYGDIGSEIQYHIRGNMFPESLINKGTVGFNFDTGKVCIKNGKPAYWNAPQTVAGKVLNVLNENEREAALKAGFKPMNVTWKQQEATPDGPDFYSFFIHRVWDIPRYFLLKKWETFIQTYSVGGKYTPRPQIAAYKSVKKGRGVGDTTPIIIRRH